MKRYLLTLWLCLAALAVSAKVDEAWVRSHYAKTEQMVAMRDGVKLYTAVYAPTDTLPHPIIIYRSTYGSGPYGEEFDKNLWGRLEPYTAQGYIIAKQDVRGQRMSEGEFENVCPVNKFNAAGANDVTDVYDTADWILANTNSNGRIGLKGNSYLGYTAFVAALSGHPAIKAVCPQAPIGDWFLGDDFHRNGAFMPSHSFSFLSGFGQKRKAPSPVGPKKHKFYSDDEYSFYLRNRAIPHLSALFADSIPFWNELMAHPDYDKFWFERNPTNLMDTVAPAMMVVGGWFDAEDLYGALNLYRRMEQKSPSTPLYFLMGPWSHGGWRGKGDKLGALRFGANTGEVYRDLELQFFNHYLLDRGPSPENKVTAFATGSNSWHKFAQWPPAEIRFADVFLHDNGVLDAKMPAERKASSSFVSDPTKPVPHTATVANSTGGQYMYEDQRFAGRRPDVLTFVSEPLDSTVTLAGVVLPRIWMSVDADDADLVVKLIDVYPDDFAYAKELKPEKYPMGGYQQLVRGDIMPLRYRDSFAEPKPVKANTPTLIEMPMPDIFHTFGKGHRIMVQIQSSWFPLFRMHPQRYVDLYHASDADFRPARVTIHHDASHPSSLRLPLLPAQP